MIILGIDPGLTCCGYAIVTKLDDFPVLLDSGFIKTNPKKSIADRCYTLYSTFAYDLIPKHNPNIVSLEDQYIGNNPKTVSKLISAKTACLLAAAHHNILVKQYMPNVIKKSILRGNASKQAIRSKLQRVLGCQIQGSLDVSDAIAIAFTAFKLTRAKIL